jgi:hypothetical protein
MTSPLNIRSKGLEKHYKQWRTSHPDAITYSKLVNYLDNGDEFGRRVPIEILADLCKTSKNTMLKWMIVYEEQRPKNVQAG